MHIVRKFWMYSHVLIIMYNVQYMHNFFVDYDDNKYFVDCCLTVHVYTLVILATCMYR